MGAKPWAWILVRNFYRRRSIELLEEYETSDAANAAADESLKRQQNTRNLVSGITCVVVAILSFFVILYFQRAARMIGYLTFMVIGGMLGQEFGETLFDQFSPRIANHTLKVKLTGQHPTQEQHVRYNEWISCKDLTLGSEMADAIELHVAFCPECAKIQSDLYRRSAVMVNEA